MIRLLLTDLDGTLTNGTYILFSNPEMGVAKQFNTRDFHGIKLLQADHDIRVVVVTMAGSAVIDNHIDRLRQDANLKIELMAKVQDKRDAIYARFIDSGQYGWNEIAFIGDDVNDIELLKMVEFAACPSNAEIEVKKVIENHTNGYVCERRGGEGCVREFCDLIRGCNV